jgi:hypothetical protein
MHFLRKKSYAKCSILLALFAAFLLLTASMAQAAVTLETDLATWESMVHDTEVFETTQENIQTAVIDFAEPPTPLFPLTGINDKVGPILIFNAEATGLSRSFMLEALQEGAGFTFNEWETTIVDSYQLSLSVGDIDNYEDDDWSLSALDGVSMMAFGVEIRQSWSTAGEKITLYSGGIDGEIVGEILLDVIDNLPDSNEDYFIGIISDVPFDTIGFNEDPTGDDIAIADFRFVTAKQRCYKNHDWHDGYHDRSDYNWYDRNGDHDGYDWHDGYRNQDTSNWYGGYDGYNGSWWGN